MKILLTILCLFVQSMRASTDDVDLPCTCSRFEYEYKILKKLVELAQEMDNLKKASKDQADELDQLQKANAEVDNLSKKLDKLKKANNDQADELDQLKKANEEKLENIQQITQELKTIKGSINATDGSVYTRWGRTVCPDNGTELVYKGYAAGSIYSHTGGAANYICLPETPTWGKSNDAPSSTGAFVYGAEYETGYLKTFLTNLQNDDASCAVCRSIRPTSLMIPGRNNCMDSTWTLEYAGYLAAGHYTHVAASEYVCLDSEPTGKNDTVSLNGKLFYLAEARCGSLPCPPYTNGRELTCAVCTK